MPNNFRVIGDRYFSKAGHDSNDGLTPNTPKKSISSIAYVSKGTINVLGSGYYTGVKSGGNCNVVGDGIVIIESTNYVIDSVKNVWFKSSIISCPVSNRWAFENNIAQNTIFNLSYVFTLNFLRSKVIGCTINHTSTALCSLSYAIVLSTSVTRASVINNSYIDQSSVLAFSTNPTPSTFRNNNIQGILILGGIKYAIQDQFIGTPQDNGYASDVYWLSETNLTANVYTGTITGWNAAVATCINRDPKFNDASKMDFTLKADSPHIGRASDGVSNIGGTSYAQSFYAGVSNPNILLLQPSLTIDTSNISDWKLQVGAVEGTIRAIIKVANTNEVITSLPYIGNKAFNSDVAGGTSTNFNVPDSKPTTSAYPSYLTTTATASDVYRVVIANHGFSAGVWLKVDGQYREVTSVTTNELIFLTAVRGIVSSGTAVQVGALNALSSLNPNRLNYLMRSSVLDVVDSSNWDNPLTWDNNNLADAGDYLEQEWDRQPLIDNLNKCGFGDDNFDANYGNPIQVKYIDIIIYLRNNYKS